MVYRSASRLARGFLVAIHQSPSFQRFFNVAADLAQQQVVVRFNQRNRGAFLTCTPGTTDTVQIDVGGARHIEVKDVADVRNIDTAGGDVGSDQHVYAAIGQTLDGFVTLGLHHLAFQPAGVNPGFTQPVGQLMHALALAHKDDSAGSFRLLQQIHQWYYRADDVKHKTALLVHLLKQPEATRSIVFVRKRERVHELAGWLREAGINTCWLEGEMVQAKRNEAISRLTDGRINVLIATDVAARGIDIADVSHVFNFDLPRTADIYLHRIGRTGRAGKKGTAISLVEAHDHLLLGKIGRYIEEPLKARVIDELRPTTRAPSEKQTGKPSKKVLAKRAEKKEKEKEKPRVKKRHRDTKNIGKRRKPSAADAPQKSNEE